MEITTKILKKLLLKKYREKFSLCILEGEKIIDDNKDKILKIFNESEIGTLENYNGRIAVAKIPEPTKPTIPFLVLDRIQDPGNMGTILRTAMAFGYKTIYTINCVDTYSPKVIRSSSGMCLDLNIIHVDYNGLPDDVVYHIADTKGEEPSRPDNRNFGIVLGNEGQGVSDEIFKKNHKIISIPMQEGCESLNVAVAGGIIMCYYK